MMKTALSFLPSWWSSDRLVASMMLASLLLLTPTHKALAVVNTHAIEGYSNVQSVGPTETISFYIHLPAGRTAYTVEIYRFGTTYVGASAIGSRILGPLVGTNGMVQNFDGKSYLDGAGWATSFTLTLPSATVAGAYSFPPLASHALSKATWTSGIYTAKITDTVSKEFFHITFIVKDGSTTRKPIALIASTNTWTAYNFWPGQVYDDGTGKSGSSIYKGANNIGGARNKVTFLRPNPYATPVVYDDIQSDVANRPFLRTEHLAAGEIRVAHWLEVNRKAYSMLTDWDLHSIPNVLDPAVFKTVIISTHSEYWSPNMYNAIKAYLDAGGNVISLSGNTCYWNVTLDTDILGNRTLDKGPPPIVPPSGRSARALSAAATLGATKTLASSRARSWKRWPSSFAMLAAASLATRGADCSKWPPPVSPASSRSKARPGRAPVSSRKASRG